MKKFATGFGCVAICAGAAHADAMMVFDRLSVLFQNQPNLIRYEAGETPCGIGPQSNDRVAYCASNDTVYYTDALREDANGAYEMAHVLGHYLQIEYGVADIALREIRARRTQEAALRAMVTQQVDCVAGVLVANAGLGFVDLTDAYANEPMTGAHWGRRPIDGGPQVSIGLDARAQAYRTGYRAGDVAACGVGEMSADLLVRAQRSPN